MEKHFNLSSDRLFYCFPSCYVMCVCGYLGKNKAEWLKSFYPSLLLHYLTTIDLRLLTPLLVLTHQTKRCLQDTHIYTKGLPIILTRHFSEITKKRFHKNFQTPVIPCMYMCVHVSIYLASSAKNNALKSICLFQTSKQTQLFSNSIRPTGSSLVYQ